MQPQRKGRSLSQLAGRCQTLGACVHGSLLGNPRAALGAQGPGGPTQNRGLGDAEGSAGGRPPKEPPGHVPDTHLFTSSRPGRSAVPCKFRIAPHDERPRLRAGCVSGSPGYDPLGAAAAAAAASAGGPAGVSRSASSLGTAAGRASSAPRGRDAAVRRAGAPSWPGACSRRGAASSWRAWTNASAFSGLHRSQASLSFAQFPASRFSHKDLFPYLKCWVCKHHYVVVSIPDFLFLF